MDFDGGWDSRATLVGGRWIDRRPRRPEVAGRLRMESRLMPWLAPRLPLPVPVPSLVRLDPLVARHSVVPGEPMADFDGENGRRLGAFLRVLHGIDVAEAVRQGLPDAEHAVRERVEEVALFRAEVLVRLPAGIRREGQAQLDAIEGLPTDTTIHADVGPDHLLCVDGRLAGVIDFSDAHAGDAALDLAWCLHGSPPEFADALAEEYGVTPELRERALLWHRFGPWYDVYHGLTNDLPAEVRSGLAEIPRRLAQRV